MPRLLKKYRNEMQGKIKEKLGLSNLMEVPRIDKVTLNMGVGEAVTDKKVLEKAMENLSEENTSEEGAIKTILEFSVINNLFFLKFFRNNHYPNGSTTELILTWKTIKEEKIVSDICENCKTADLNNRVTMLVEKLVGGL